MAKVTARAKGKQQSVKPKRPAYSTVSAKYMQIHNIDSTAAKYKFIGGQAEKEYLSMPNEYANACALRMSYALNYGGMELGKNKLPASGTKLKDKNGKTYITGAVLLGELFMKNFGRPDFLRYQMTTKEANRTAHIDLVKLNKKGVIAMRISGWTDATGHASVWNGSSCLDGTDYLNDKRPEVQIVDLQFWELK